MASKNEDNTQDPPQSPDMKTFFKMRMDESDKKTQQMEGRMTAALMGRMDDLVEGVRRDVKGIENTVKVMDEKIEKVNDKVEDCMTSIGEHNERMNAMEKRVEELSRGEGRGRRESQSLQHMKEIEDFQTHVGVRPVTVGIGESEREAYMRVLGYLSLDRTQLINIEDKLLRVFRSNNSEFPDRMWGVFSNNHPVRLIMDNAFNEDKIFINQ